jgi:multidrug efflux pump subunit AcrB
MSRFNLSALAVRENSVTLFTIVAISVTGVFAFLHLGRAEDPSFAVKFVTVQASWPGATAQEMQDLVAEPLEKRIQELRWYDHVETFTRPAQAFMLIALKDDMPPADLQEEFYQARKKIGDEARHLPQGALPPVVNDEYSDTTFALYALKAKGLESRLLARQAEVYRERLLHVPGVEKVNILGERPEQVFVGLSSEKLATLDLTPNDIFAALSRQNLVTAGGSIDTNGPQVFVRVEGAYDNLQKIMDTPVAAGGRSFKLSDIADVERGYEDPPTYLVRHNGEPVLLIGVVMRAGWNGVDLGKALDVEEKRIQSELPLGVSFTEIVNQKTHIVEAFNEFMVKFFVALAVVMAVSLISLGWRVGIVVAAAVPLTLACLLVIMMLTHRDFNRISLGAIVLALGLLVDDAIIAIEMMVVKLHEGYERTKAAAYAWSHTAAPMLAGTLLTIIGLMPIGFAQSGAGEYAGGIFWIVGYALIASWFVAVLFTPYLGFHLLPNIKPVEGGHDGIYSTPAFRRFRALVVWVVGHKFMVALGVVAIFFLAVFGMGFVQQQFFPGSERPELMVEVRMPEGSSIEATDRATTKVEAWLKQQPEAKNVTTSVGAGLVRFVLYYNPELPDPAFAKIVVITPETAARDRLKWRLRAAVEEGLAPEALVRVNQLVFGPPVPYPVAFRVTGPDPAILRGIAAQVQSIMRTNPAMRQVTQDWGPRVPELHFVLDQDRLRLIGLTPSQVSEQLQFLLTGVPVTQVREDIRTVNVVARAQGAKRLDPSKIGDFTLRGTDGRLVPLSQLGKVEVRDEDPILRRRDREPVIEVRGDNDERLQPPEVSAQVAKSLAPLQAKLPAGYRFETGGAVEASAKANLALAKVFPAMLVLILVTIMLQVRSFPALGMTFLTAPLGLAGAVPVLLLFKQPFGFDAILGLIGLAGILMRNSLIFIGQIQTNLADGMDEFHAVVEATVMRARPVVLTALAAVMAFVPLTFSAFWGSMAYTLIGGTAGGTALTLVFLPAAYAIWFKVRPPTHKATARPSLRVLSSSVFSRLGVRGRIVRGAAEIQFSGRDL